MNCRYLLLPIILGVNNNELFQWNPWFMPFMLVMHLESSYLANIFRIDNYHNIHPLPNSLAFRPNHKSGVSFSSNFAQVTGSLKFFSSVSVLCHSTSPEECQWMYTLIILIASSASRFSQSLAKLKLPFIRQTVN